MGLGASTLLLTSAGTALGQQTPMAAVPSLPNIPNVSSPAQPSPKNERAALVTEVNNQIVAVSKTDRNLVLLQSILAQPEDSIDLAKAEVAIEKMVDPRVNEAVTLNQLDQLAVAIKAKFPQGDATDPEQKALLLISSLKDPGPWNGNKPFLYDLDNPLGKNPEDKLLSTYLTTHKGNCVSMPVLFVVLGQKLGLPVTLSTAPFHAFARLRKDDGTWLNIEVTSYGTISDESYQRQMDITPLAIQKGTYLKTLTRKQSVLVMAGTLMQFYSHHRSPDQQLALTSVVLMTDSSNVDAWIWRGDAYGQMMDDRFIKRYGSVEKIPASKRQGYDILHQNNGDMFRRAEELGWVAETPEHQAQYLEGIKKVKAARRGG